MAPAAVPAASQLNGTDSVDEYLVPWPATSVHFNELHDKICTRAYVFVCVQALVHVCISVCVSFRVCAYVVMCVCVCMCAKAPEQSIFSALNFLNNLFISLKNRRKRGCNHSQDRRSGATGRTSFCARFAPRCMGLGFWLMIKLLCILVPRTTLSTPH